MYRSDQIAFEVFDPAEDNCSQGGKREWRGSNTHGDDVAFFGHPYKYGASAGV